MGAFFKAFWRQLGRNTGNRVSNAIFGDKWSSPYRVAVNQGGKQHGRKNSTPPNNRKNKKRTKQSSAVFNKGCLYWIAAIILFCGTYSVLINPYKDDIILVIMLWLSAIGFFFYKRSKI